MVEQKATAIGRAADDAARSEALEHWYRQEAEALEDDPAQFAAGEADDREFVSGWWILPVILLSIPAWIALVFAVI